MKDKIILDLCGGTGAWSRPYEKAGYKVFNITLPAYDVTDRCCSDGYLIFWNQNGKIHISIKVEEVYGILAAPPCEEFSFAKTNSKYPRDIEKGMKIVKACLDIIWECQHFLPTPLAKRTYLKFWALENPFGLLRRYLGLPVLTFNPYDYGDSYQKKTCLWGFFNKPKKNPCKEYTKDYIHHITPNGKIGKKFDRLLNKEIHPERMDLTRKERRAITPQGFAQAFFEANQ